jgi:hypothetical protein
MNVYEKLQKARVELQSASIKKSGQNTFSNYDYFELGDFLPMINTIFNELKLFSQVSFSQELATLKIINTEKPEEVIEFTSPMADAQLKGCHPIQNLGAVQTYQRRYLYMAALEIVEHDILDSGHTQKEDKPTQKEDKPKTIWRDKYIDKATEVGFEFDEIRLLAEKTGRKSFNDLPDNTFKKLFDRLNQGEEAVEKAKEFIKGAK